MNSSEGAGCRDFSAEAYRGLIRTGRQAGYRFVTFGQVADGVEGNLLCLMRHDIDVNLQYAASLARLEADDGLSATYFVMLRSPAYNLLSRASSSAVREIVALGHEIGVHFDAQHPLATREGLVDQVLDETRIVEGLAGARVRAVSFHQPSEYILASEIEVPGLINTYNKRQLAGWHYLSDSNRDWRGQDPGRLLAEAVAPRVQLLTHPMWWMVTAPTTEAVWDAALKDNFETMQRQFLDTEGAYGPARRLRVGR